MNRVAYFRHHFHQYPEGSNKEVQTQQFIINQLKTYEIPFQCFSTGILAHIGEGDHAIALRADMDGLPIEEKSQVDFCSKRQGWMHACGHDMHMAMLLEAALQLKQNEAQLQGRVYIVFQPSEEKRPGGARLLLPFLLDKGVEAIFGQHIAPEYPSGIVAIRQGSFFASSDNVTFSITGKGTHAATPQKGSDPILAAAMIIQFLQTVITKFRDPMTPAVLSITAINGGTSNNIIPDKVEILGTVRCHDNRLRDQLFAHIYEGATAIARLYHCAFTSTSDPTIGLPVLVNNESLYNHFIEWCDELRSELTCIESERVMLGEDFAIYTEKIPGCFWRLGVAKKDEILPPLHSPMLAPSDCALSIGVSLLTKIAQNYFHSINDKVKEINVKLTD